MPYVRGIYNVAVCQRSFSIALGRKPAGGAAGDRRPRYLERDFRPAARALAWLVACLLDPPAVGRYHRSPSRRDQSRAQDHPWRSAPASQSRDPIACHRPGLDFNGRDWAERARSADLGCASAWNKDPVSGVIGVQTGPLLTMGLQQPPVLSEAFYLDACCGDNFKDTAAFPCSG